MLAMISRFFSNGQVSPRRFEFKPRTFLECLEIVRDWTAQARFDPDMEFNDSKLRMAMNTNVTCPYCASEYRFDEAIKSYGASVSVECPICHTTPQIHPREEYEVA
jgi:uncharacterized Zn-finger protein